MPRPVELGHFVGQMHRAGKLVVQPRMGFAEPARMADGLTAVMNAPASTVGTITLDSYTRVGDFEGARDAVERGLSLNGYPIVSHSRETTRNVIASTEGNIPIQVRHGSPMPGRIFEAMVDLGLAATEGGPVSYCLPYSRTPLAESVVHWRDAVSQLVDECRSRELTAHIETFGGCLLGQMCPPSLLLAVSTLEGLYFVQHGVTSMSLSYAQQTNPVQDIEALAALRDLASSLLPTHVDWHVVLYTYMGVYPKTAPGALSLLQQSAEVAVRGGAERLIVKTVAEAWRIPTIDENVDALIHAARCAEYAGPHSTIPWAHEVDYADVLHEARVLIDAVLQLSDDVGTALVKAFASGLLDVPFCLHQDNRGLARAAIDGDGRLQWSRLGHLPLAPAALPAETTRLRARGLLRMLNYTASCHDQALTGLRTTRPITRLDE